MCVTFLFCACIHEVSARSELYIFPSPVYASAFSVCTFDFHPFLLPSINGYPLYSRVVCFECFGKMCFRAPVRPIFHFKVTKQFVCFHLPQHFTFLELRSLPTSPPHYLPGVRRCMVWRFALSTTIIRKNFDRKIKMCSTFSGFFLDFPGFF